MLALAGLLLAGASLDLSLAYFRPVPFVLMVLGVGAMAAAAWLRTGPELPRRDLRFQLLVAVFGLLYGLIPILATPPQRLVLLVPVIVVLSVVSRRVRRVWFWAVLAVMVGSHAGHIAETAGLRSDINIFFDAALRALLHGQTIYQPVPVPGLPPTPLVYPPGSLLLMAPSLLLTGDMRWALLAGELVACAVTWKLLPRWDGEVEPWREALVLIPLVVPRVGEYFFEAANHDWVVLAVLALAILAMTRAREVVAGLLLGLAFSTKQTVLLYPGVFLLRLVRPRIAVLAVAVLIVTLLPFLAQDFHATALALLDPSTHGAGDYPDRLHLYAALLALGMRPGDAMLVSFQLAGVLLGFVFWRRSRGSLPRSLSAAGVAWMLLVLLSPFSGYNYYAYGIALFAWGVALEAKGRPVGVGGRTSPGSPGIPGDPF